MWIVVWLVTASAGVRAGSLWPRGVVHYTISSKDYDPHSQDLITSTFSRMEREICVKFFHSPSKGSATERVLLIHNPDRVDACDVRQYNYSGSVVEMVIGYKCLNTKDITRIVVDMLRASIEENEPPISSYDLMSKFKEKDHSPSTVLAPTDRNLINSHYFTECGSLSRAARPAHARRADTPALTTHTADYYKDKLWPLGIVMYGVDDAMRGSPAHTNLKFAMTSVELASCIVFQFQEGTGERGVLAPRNVLWFGRVGADVPLYGFREGNQSINLNSMVSGAPGHTAHTLNNLLRLLGVPMMSNRYDRDNYLRVHWNNVDTGKEYLLEKQPEVAWVQSVPYDFHSVTHAPANFVCRHCRLGAVTVEPIQDPLWQRTLSMGHRTTLSQSDVTMLHLLYGNECQKRLQ